jgi:lipoprotein-releasing system permease protein
MPYEIFLALRYLRVRRGRRVVKLTALAALAGIACGVAALIVALALANGFRDELRDKILRGTAHITASRADESPSAGAREVVARLRSIEGVTDAAPTTYEGALLSGPVGAAYTVLRGVDEESARARDEIRRTIIRGSFDAPTPLPQTPSADTADAPPAHIVVGEELAARTGLGRVGDEGWIITGEHLPVPPGFSPRARRVRVAGIFRTGLYDYDAAWTYLPLADVERVAGENLKSRVVAVEVRDIYATGAVADRMRRALGEAWTVVDWRDANRPLFDALELERRTVALIIMLILALAALNITTTLALVVFERRADIAVLGALGARPGSITVIFMIEGAAIGALGALAGVALGLAACAVCDYFGLVRLPPDVYSLSVIPLRPHARDVLWPALAAFAVSLLATVYPARAAARVRPAEALRYE